MLLIPLIEKSGVEQLCAEFVATGVPGLVKLAERVPEMADEVNAIVAKVNQAAAVQIAVETCVTSAEDGQARLAALEKECKDAVAALFEKHLGAILQTVFTTTHKYVFSLGGLKAAKETFQKVA